MLNFIMGLGTKTDTFLWVALVLICAYSIYRQGVERESHKEAWKNWQDFEPVLGATPWSYITAPIYKLFRLFAVDLFTTHAVFVIGTFGLLDKFLEKMAAQGWFLGAALLALHAVSWLNFAFPKYRPQFFDSVLGIIRALGNKITPGTFQNIATLANPAQVGVETTKVNQ